MFGDRLKGKTREELARWYEKGADVDGDYCTANGWARWKIFADTREHPEKERRWRIGECTIQKLYHLAVLWMLGTKR